MKFFSFWFNISICVLIAITLATKHLLEGIFRLTRYKTSSPGASDNLFWTLTFPFASIVKYWGALSSPVMEYRIVLNGATPSSSLESTLNTEIPEASVSLILMAVGRLLITGALAFRLTLTVTVAALSAAFGGVPRSDALTRNYNKFQ